HVLRFVHHCSFRELHSDADQRSARRHLPHNEAQWYYPTDGVGPSPRAAVAHTCQARCRTAVPRLLSIRYRQRPSAPRGAVSLAALPGWSCSPGGPVPSIDQSTTIGAMAPGTNTWCAVASSGRPRLRSRSSLAAISVRWVTVRPSFAMSTASGSYKVII